MLYENAERESVEKMVRTFYARVIEDDVVGPFFIRALGRDLKNAKWYEHLNTLDRFWMLMMTGERHGYWGDPFPPHAFIGPLERTTFERWLKIFREVVDELFVADVADKFYLKASTLAEQFMENLDVDGDEDDD